MGFVAILRCQRLIALVDAFVSVFVQQACAVYVPRVVLSSYQFKVCCCCAICSDHGLLSSQVLFVAGSLPAGFLAVWLQAGKM